MKSLISIISISSVSPLGCSNAEILDAYRSNRSLISKTNIEGNQEYVTKLSESSQSLTDSIKKENQKFKDLDPSVHYSIAASRSALKQAGWSLGDNIGINIGSSRGATHLFEKHYRQYIANGKCETLSSPTTTLGNISSWVAQDLMAKGFEFSHSITCSTGLQSLLNGIAWLNSGLADKFIAGASEAPLTAFTIAQMKALKIYSVNEDEYPCRALDFSKKHNSMILGEGAVSVALEKGIQKNAIALITGIGYATEILDHNVSLSAEATCFQKSMKMALQNKKLEEIDAVIMHAPGTVKGDWAEFKAIQKVFGDRLPYLTSNKWKIGHTFASSGLFSLEMAILMIQNQEYFYQPFYKQSIPEKVDKILINSVGFGGNAVSVLVEKL